MGKQNVLQKKHLHLYSIQISSTPKTSSYSMWNILKWKSRASEHEVPLAEDLPTQLNDDNLLRALPYLSYITDEDVQKMRPLSSRILWSAHWALPEKYARSRCSHWAVLAPTPPAPHYRPHGLSAGQQSCPLASFISSERNASNIC